MPISVPTSQNIPANGSPIVAVLPPPEGQQGASVTYTFPAASISVPQFQAFQMSSQAGLPMSQVVSLCIDNTENPYPCTVTHGAFNEQVTVAAFAYLIVPTFSNKGPYGITLALSVTGPTPINPSVVTVLFLNYSRPSASFAGAALSGSTPSQTMGSSAGVASGLALFSTVGAALPVNISYENWYLWDIDIFIGSGNAVAAADQCIAGFELIWGSNAWPAYGFAISETIQTFPIAIFSQRAKWSFNSSPFQGNINTTMNIQCTQLTNLTSCNVVVALTLTGAGTP